MTPVNVYIAEGGKLNLVGCINMALVPRIAETVVIPTRPGVSFLVTSVGHDLTRSQEVSLVLRELVPAEAAPSGTEAP